MRGVPRLRKVGRVDLVRVGQLLRVRELDNFDLQIQLSFCDITQTFISCTILRYLTYPFTLCLTFMEVLLWNIAYLIIQGFRVQEGLSCVPRRGNVPRSVHT